MAGDIPVFQLFVAGIVAIVPGLIAAFVAGGRGILFLIVLAAVAAGCYLIWMFGLSDRGDWTGMEGIALFVIPIMWAAAAFWLVICYALVSLLGGLPQQRRTAKGEERNSDN